MIEHHQSLPLTDHRQPTLYWPCHLPHIKGLCGRVVGATTYFDQQTRPPHLQQTCDSHTIRAQPHAGRGVQKDWSRSPSFAGHSSVILMHHKNQYIPDDFNSYLCPEVSYWFLVNPAFWINRLTDNTFMISFRVRNKFLWWAPVDTVSEVTLSTVWVTTFSDAPIEHFVTLSFLWVRRHR